MTVDAAYMALVGELLGVWLKQLSYWLSSQPMFILFSLTVLLYICQMFRVLIGR